MQPLIKRVQYDPTSDGAYVEIFYRNTVNVEGQTLELADLFKKTVFFEASNPQYAALMNFFQSVIETEET